MQELEKRMPNSELPPVYLWIVSTDIPADWLPRGKDRERLVIPTSARLFVKDDCVIIEMIAVDESQRYDQYYEPPSFDDDEPPIITTTIRKENILRLVIGGRGAFGHNPTAKIIIRDPLDVVDGLSFTFEAHDPNNPNYLIKLLAKLLREQLAVAVEDTRERDSDEIPF